MAMRLTSTMANATNIAVRNAAYINGDNLKLVFHNNYIETHLWYNTDAVAEQVDVNQAQENSAGQT